MSLRRLGVLGGTFDPIHVGHLAAGDAAVQALALDELLVVPAHDPPHRPMVPQAGAFHRFALAALAIDGRPGWRLSDSELARSGPSYTADTLRALHVDGWRPSQIFFILGADAFAEIATWYDFPAVLDDAHFAVVSRPATRLDTAAGRVDAVRTRLRHVPRGAQLGPLDADRPCVVLIDAETPGVSSTEIRSRLAARQPITDLVPASVARYIHAHNLYDARAVGDLHGQKERTHG